MILVWMGCSNLGLYEEDIRPYALPLADPGQPMFVLPHLQLQLQDVQQLMTMYTAMPDPQAVQPTTTSKKRQHSVDQGTQQVAKKHTTTI